MHIRSAFKQTLLRLQEPRRWIQVLLGPRQVGKTTGALYIQNQLDQASGISSLFVAADDPTLRDRLWLEQQWISARKHCVAKQGRFLLIIDEVQKIEGWSETVKRLWDEDTRTQTPLKILLLGSATLLIQKGLTESLAGRFEINPVTHWLFPEMKAAFGFSVQDWVYFGGYPGPAPLRNEPLRWAAFVRDSLIESTLSKDILMMQRIEKPALLRRLFQLTCSHSGQILSFQKMLGQLHDAGNAMTLAHYLDLLNQAGLAGSIPKFSGNIIREKASSPKLQAHNPALMSALKADSPESLVTDPESWGKHVESAVGAHLINSLPGTLMELYYWKQGNQEVDFVLKKDDRIIAIEVKSGASRKSLPGLKAFSSRFPETRSLIVGDSYGIRLDDFFSTPVENYFTN